MKAKIMSAVLFAALFGCRENYVNLTPREDYGIAIQVVLRADFPEADGSMAVPKEDSTNASIYMLRAYVYNYQGMVLLRPVEWRISDRTVVELTPFDDEDPPTHESRAMVRAVKDIFDLGGENEPEAVITACVANTCESGSGEVECLPEICSNSLTVKGVVNAEGAWELEGATFPFTVQLYASQTGRTLEAISSYYKPTINGRQINFSAGSTSYVGHFTDRTHVTGEAFISPSGDNLGIWTAVKCPDTGCTGAGP